MGSASMPSISAAVEELHWPGGGMPGAVGAGRG